MSSTQPLSGLSVDKISQDWCFLLYEFYQTSIIFFTIRSVDISHLNESFFTFSDFLLYDFISSIVIEVHLLLNGVHLNKRIKYQMFNIKTVVIKYIFNVFDLWFDLLTSTLNWFHLFLRLGFMADFKIVNFLRKQENSIFGHFFICVVYKRYFIEMVQTSLRVGWSFEIEFDFFCWFLNV